MRYDTDFPRAKRKLKDGTIADYAGTYCYECQASYQRDLRRMNSRLEGRATRVNDTPWKKYRPTVYSAPFLKWLDAWLRENKVTLKEVCAKAGFTSTRPVRNWRRTGEIGQPFSAELILDVVGHPELGDLLLYRYTKAGRAAGISVDSEPFFNWLRKYMMRNNASLEQVCRGAGITSRTVRRWRDVGKLPLANAEKFFIYAKQPHMSRVLYPDVSEKRAA